MSDTGRHTATAKVLWHFTMSLDALVAGPGHGLAWMTGFEDAQRAHGVTFLIRDVM